MTNKHCKTQVNLRLTKTARERLEELSNRSGMTLSYVVEWGIKEMHMRMFPGRYENHEDFRYDVTKAE